MRKGLIMLVSASLCLMVGVAIGRIWQARLRPSQAVTHRIYFDNRSFALREAAMKAPDGLTLLIGDSITEFAWLPSLCGRPTFNGGISAARVQEMIGPAATLTRLLRPAHVFVALGTNDARQGRTTPISEFERSYAKLLGGIGPVSLTLVGVMPFDFAHPGHGGMLDPAAVDAENRVIRAFATQRRAGFVALPAGVETEDGIHPTPDGSRTWLAALSQACPRSN